jgi:hypothetical protein
MLRYLAILGGIATVVQVVMSFARTGPEEAKQKLGQWADLIHLPALAAFLRRYHADTWILYYGSKFRFLVFLAIAAVFGAWVYQLSGIGGLWICGLFAGCL